MAKAAASLARFNRFRSILKTSKSLVDCLQISTGWSVASSDLEQPATERDRYRVRPVVRAKFVDYILDMEIDGVLRN